MSDLTFLEKRKLEAFLGMEQGHVLNFSHRTLRDFVADTVRLDLSDGKYGDTTYSKANRIRTFWSKEPNHVVARLLRTMMQLQASDAERNGWKLDAALGVECQRIVDRLAQDGVAAEADALTAEAADEDFGTVAREVRDAINTNKPEAGLDRLHTYLTKFVRLLCTKHGLPAGREIPLHGLFGGYVKNLRTKKLLESDMTERILLSNISILEAFNHVRNNKTMAHDNELLGYDESRLIFGHVAAVVQFVRALEEKLDGKNRPAKPAPSKETWDDDIPF